MDEEIQSDSPKVENLPKHNLSWVDLSVTMGGIVGIYLILSVVTFKLMEWWPHERALIYMNAFITQLSFLFLIWSLKKIRHWKWADFGWQAVPVRKLLKTVMGLYALTWVINISYAFVLYRYGLTPPTTDVYTKLLGQTTWYTLILNLLLAGVLAPLVEEMLFRGVIFGSLQAYFGKWTAAVFSAAIFSGLHLQVYGFFPRFILGMVLAYLYDKYKSLYPSVALHSFNNILATLIAAGLSI